MSGNFLLIFICNFHVLNHLLLIYICNLHWNRSKEIVSIDRTKSDLPLLSSERGLSYLLDEEASASFLSRNMTAFVVFLGFYPMMLLATVSLPNNWTYFSLSQLRQYSQFSSSSIPPLLEEYGSCWQLRVSDYLVLKLYPDILMYYLFLYSVTALGTLSQCCPSLRRVLHQRPAWALKLYLGELLLVFGLALLLIGEFLYWYYDHAYQNSSVLLSPNETAARSMGQLCNVVAGLLVLPISRNSVWASALGLSWESVVVYHTYLGGLFLVLMTVHALLFWKVFDEFSPDGFPHDILAVPTVFHPDNFTIPLASFTGFLAILIMGGGSYHALRRYNYEMFYFLHHFSMVLFALMLWHAAMAWYYITPGLILWAVDHFLRLSNCLGIHTRLLSICVEGSGNISSIAYTTKSLPVEVLRFFSGQREKANPPFRYAMGQYCFVNIPAISPFEWHPFSISSAPEDSVTTHHVKSMGSSQWTGKVNPNPNV